MGLVCWVWFVEVGCWGWFVEVGCRGWFWGLGSGWFWGLGGVWDGEMWVKIIYFIKSGIFVGQTKKGCALKIL